MGQGALPKPVVQWWLSLNSSRRQAGVRLVPIETSGESLLSSLFVHAGARGKYG